MRGEVGGTLTGDGASRRSRAEDGEEEGSFARDKRGGVGVVIVVGGRGEFMVKFMIQCYEAPSADQMIHVKNEVTHLRQRAQAR